MPRILRIALAFAVTGLTLVADPLLTAGPAKALAPVYKPDEMVSRETRDSKGDNIYNTDASGQTVMAKVSSGKGDYFFVDTQNDGSGIDSIVVTGCHGGGKFTVTYKDGSTDVTPQVTGSGYTYSSLGVGALAPNPIKITIKSKATAKAGDKFRCQVTGTSTNDSSKVDVVEANLGIK